MTAASEEKVMAALEAVIRSGDPEDLVAWAATGEAGVALLRDVLTGSGHPRLEDVGSRDVGDGLMEAAGVIAGAQPEAFLQTFSDPTFESDRFVLTGLGYVTHPRATERLANAARSDDEWVRMAAAISLGRHNSDVAAQALTALIADPAYLVRYHALKGLARIGDASAVMPLRAALAFGGVERDLAERALERITERGGRRPDRLEPGLLERVPPHYRSGTG